MSQTPIARTLRRAAVIVIALVVAGAAGFALRGCATFDRPVTVTSLSPDDSLRVTMEERSDFIDRNFSIRLEELKTGTSRIVFRSPDEGRPVGSERIIWSADGSRFLVLGRHFFATDRGQLSSGEQAYLMVDVVSGQVWCNADAASQESFGIEELRANQWFGWSPP
jgi:hypothetical protein